MDYTLDVNVVGADKVSGDLEAGMMVCWPDGFSCSGPVCGPVSFSIWPVSVALGSFPDLNMDVPCRIADTR